MVALVRPGGHVRRQCLQTNLRASHLVEEIDYLDSAGGAVGCGRAGGGPHVPAGLSKARCTCLALMMRNCALAAHGLQCLLQWFMLRPWVRAGQGSVGVLTLSSALLQYSAEDLNSTLERPHPHASRPARSWLSPIHTN